MLRQWAHPSTHPTRRPVIRMHLVHHLPSQMYARVGQKTWRNSDEVVTKLGLLLAVLFRRARLVHSGRSENNQQERWRWSVDFWPAKVMIPEGSGGCASDIAAVGTGSISCGSRSRSLRACEP